MAPAPQTLTRSLAARLMAAHPAEAARTLDALPDAEVVTALADADPTVGAGVLSRLAPHRAARALTQCDRGVAREIVSRLGFDAAAGLIRRMDDGSRTSLVDGLDPMLAKPLRSQLAFPEGTAGSVMDPQVLALPEDLSAGEAVEQVRRHPGHVRYVLFVVDREHRLVGALNLRELLTAEAGSLLGDIATRDVHSIRGDALYASVLRHPVWREAPSLPVVDAAGRYVGAIRYRAWRRLVDELAGISDGRGSETAEALGDLFRTGFVSLLGAVTSTMAHEPHEDDRGQH